MPHRAKGVTREQYETIMRIKRYGAFKKTRMTQQMEGDDSDEMPVAVTVTCGDARRLLKLMKFQSRGCGHLIHPVTVIGGACGIHTKTPVKLSVPPPVEWIIDQIKFSALAMNTKKVNSFAHFPCGGCNFRTVSIPQQVELSLLGYGVLNEHLISKGYEITPLVHGLYGTDNGFDPRDDETFEVDRDAWLEARPAFRDELADLPVRLIELPTTA